MSFIDAPVEQPDPADVTYTDLDQRFDPRKDWRDAQTGYVARFFPPDEDDE